MNRIMPYIGALQVQVTNSLFYLTVTNAVMLAFTFWTTTGAGIAAEHAPWMGAKEFFGIVALLLLSIMLLDYKVVYPYRQGFLTRKACEFENPAMDELKALRAEVKELKEYFGIADSKDADS